MKLYNVFEILTDDTRVRVHNVHDDDVIIGGYDGRERIPKIYNNCEILGMYIDDGILQIEIDYECIYFDELDGMAAVRCLDDYIRYIDQTGVYADISELIYQVKETLMYTDLNINDAGEWFDEDGNIIGE